jgi:hypothetical protein
VEKAGGIFFDSDFGGRILNQKTNPNVFPQTSNAYQESVSQKSGKENCPRNTRNIRKKEINFRAFSRISRANCFCLVKVILITTFHNSQKSLPKLPVFGLK